VLVNEPDGVIAKQSGRVPRFLIEFVIVVPVDDARMLFVSEIVDFADERTILIIEAALSRPILRIGMTEVPLPDDCGVVARIMEGLGDQVLVGG